MLSRDLYHLRACVKAKSYRSVSLFSAVRCSPPGIKPLLPRFQDETGPVSKVRGFDQGAQTLFHYVRHCVHAGLPVPVVCVSYGGDLAQLPRGLDYDKLPAAGKECVVEMMEAPISITGIIN